MSSFYIVNLKDLETVKISDSRIYAFSRRRKRSVRRRRKKEEEQEGDQEQEEQEEEEEDEEAKTEAARNVQLWQQG